jgi:hypothetical protein
VETESNKINNGPQGKEEREREEEMSNQWKMGVSSGTNVDSRDKGSMYVNLFSLESAVDWKPLPFLRT